MCTAGYEPEELADDGAEKDPVGGAAGEEVWGWLGGVGGGVREGEFHLGGEGDGVGAGAGAVGTVLAILENVADEGEVLVLFVRGVAGWWRGFLSLGTCFWVNGCGSHCD